MGGETMIKSAIGVVLVIMVLGILLPTVLPLMLDTDTDIQAFAIDADYADLGAPLFGTIWPIVMIVVMIGIAAGVVFFALKRFNVIN